MGVIGKCFSPFSSFIGDDAEDLIVEENVDNDDGEVESVHVHSTRRHRKIKLRSPAKPMSFVKCGKYAGSKSRRRYENIIQLTGEQSAHCNSELEEISILDFMPVRVSAFAQVLQDCENMPFWDDFINCTDCDSSEEEQKHPQERHSAARNKLAKKERQEDVSDDSVETKNDRPSCDPRERFRRISARFHTLVKEERLSMSTLEELENKLISFFMEWPTNVYVTKLANAYHRLLLHSLSKYLDLISRSFNSNGVRHTQIKNQYEDFQLPTMLLSEYLREQYKL